MFTWDKDLIERPWFDSLHCYTVQNFSSFKYSESEFIIYLLLPISLWKVKDLLFVHGGFLETLPTNPDESSFYEKSVLNAIFTGNLKAMTVSPFWLCLSLMSPPILRQISLLHDNPIPMLSF